MPTSSGVPPRLRILIADDNKMFRDSLRRLLETQTDFYIVAEAVNGSDAIEKSALFQPDIVIIDYSMPELDGISAVPHIRQAAPRAEVLLLTQHDAPHTAQRALDAGARGYVVKSNASHELLVAVNTVRQHKVFISHTIARSLSPKPA